MTLAKSKKFSRFVALGAVGLPLLFALEAQAGFQWVTPLDNAPAVVAPQAQKVPVAPKKELPVAVQLPVAEPVAPAPVVSLPVVVEPVAPAVDVVVPKAVAPVVLTPVESAVVPVVETPVIEAPVIEAPKEVVPVPMQKSEVINPVAAPVVEVPHNVVELAVPTAVEVPKTAPVAEVVAPAVDAGVAHKAGALTELDAGTKVNGFGKNMPLVVVLKQTLPHGHIFAFEDGIDPSTRVSWKGGKGWRVVLADALHGAGLVGHEDNNIVSITREDNADKVTLPVMHKAETVATPAVVVPPVAVAPVAVSDVVAVPAHEIVAADVVAEPVAMAAPVIVPVEAVAQVATPAATVIESATIEEVPVESAPVVALHADAPIVAAVMESPVAVQPVTVAPIAPDVVAVSAVGKVVVPHPTLEPPLLPGASDVWKAEPGEHLRSVVKRWCDRANVELVWSTEYDYPVQAGVSLTGSFEEAVRDLLSGFVDAKPQPFGRLHDNPTAGQRTLVVQARGNTNGE